MPSRSGWPNSEVNSTNASTLRTTALAAALLACAALAASAAETPQTEGGGTDLPSYEALDTDRNGTVTLPEIVVHGPELTRRLKACDADHDEKLTRAEYAACLKAESHGGKSG